MTEYPITVNEAEIVPATVVNKKRRQRKAVKLQTLVFTRTKATGPQMRMGKDFAEQYSDLADLDREVFVAVTLNQKNRIIGSMGTLTASLVHPREAFKAAIYDNAAAIAFVHNHPSGGVSASRQDRELTERLTEAAKLLGIRLLDHIIVGAEGYWSFQEKGWL